MQTFASPEETLAYIGRMLFNRHLTDFAGGNISLRVGGVMFITPRHSGAYQHWDVDPRTIVSGEIDSDEILSRPTFSREGKAHLAVYRQFSEANAIIHSHSFHAQAFCAAGKPIAPILEANDKFGVIEPIPYAPAHSQALAENVVEALAAKRELITRHAAVLMLPRHGLFTVSKDIFLCLDAVERVDWNCFCLLAQKLLPED